MAAAACIFVSVGAFHLFMTVKAPHALRGCLEMWSACWPVDESPTRPQKYRCRARPPLSSSYFWVNLDIAQCLQMGLERAEFLH